MSETAGYRTFSGTGFGTLVVQRSEGRHETPPSASSRALLRSGLPAVYQDEDFGMRFVGALERLLDPIVGVLDGLGAHFDPDLAPRDVLDLLAAWVGVDVDEAQSIPARRETVRGAAELGRRRGTAGGLRLALKLGFPELPLRVEDEGGVVWSTDPAAAAEPRAARFVVYCDKPIPAEQQAAVARLIEQVKPVHIAYRLRVKVSRRPPAGQEDGG